MPVWRETSMLVVLTRIVFWIVCIVQVSASVLLRRAAREPRRQGMGEVSKVLLITSVGALGDGVIRGAFLKMLRLRYPSARLYLAANEFVCTRYSGYYLAHSCADELICYPDLGRVYHDRRRLLSFMRNVAQLEFDVSVIVPFMSGDNVSDWFLRLWFAMCRIPTRIGYRVLRARWWHASMRANFSTQRVWLGRHEHWRDMLSKYARALNLHESVLERGLVPYCRVDVQRQVAERKRVAIHAGGGPRPNRRWPRQSYLIVSIELCRRGFEVVLVGDDAEAEELDWIVDGVRQAVSDARIANRARACSSTALIGLIGSADVFLGNDSGPMHVAVAIGVPTIALFGPSPLAQFRPDRVDAAHRVFAGSCPFRREAVQAWHYVTTCPDGCSLDYRRERSYPRCLSDISTQTVVAAVCELLGYRDSVG